MLFLFAGCRWCLGPPETDGMRCEGGVLFLLTLSALTVAAWAATLLALFVSAVWRRRVALGIVLAVSTNALASLPILAGEGSLLWALSWIPFFFHWIC
jgi:hypothetical protein